MNRSLQAVLLTALCASRALAQSGATPEGRDLGNYNVQQSVELGWRELGESGNSSIYDTFVNQHTGLRLLEQSLSVHSLNQRGLIFDELSVSSFGYGGDPSSATRLRAYKNGWYNFNAHFRRDQNFWDYGLLANPLNPPTSSPAVPITESPHRFSTVRRMGDYNLTVAPQSRFRLRLGYSRNTSEGPSFSSVNEGGFQGAETLVFQPVRDVQDAYQLGADLRLLPRTNISFDEFLQYRKSDTSWRDQNFGFQTASGVAADLGLVFDTPFSPCANPVANGSSTPATATSICNAFLAYSRFAPARSSSPTEQLSLQSNYFKELEVTGLFSYSDMHQHADFRDFFQGLIVAQNLSQDLIAAVARSRRLASTGDFAVTWNPQGKWRVSDSFRFQDFRVPGDLGALETTLFAQSLVSAANAFSAATCPAPFTAPGCPQHTLLSTADVIASQASAFLGERERENLIKVEYDVNSKFGGNLGYRYNDHAIAQTGNEVQNLLFLPDLANRGDCASQPLLSNGSCQAQALFAQMESTPVHQHSAVLGIWARPNDALRINFDVELGFADNSFVRIDPRQWQHDRFRVHYNPAKWINLAATANVYEARNPAEDVRGRLHNQSFSFRAVLARSRRWGLDLSYDYNSIYSRALICSISHLVVANAPLCLTDSGLFQQTSFYDSSSHFGSAAVFWKPVPRVITNLGYTITHVSGDTLFLDPLTPAGALRFDYLQPRASLAFAMTKTLTWKAAWDYHDYSEDGVAGPTLPRDFHANLGTVSLKYSF